MRRDTPVFEGDSELFLAQSIMNTTSWTDVVADKRSRQAAAIPKEWLISTPPNSELTVTAIPETCGLLTEKEIVITDAPVEVLLQKMASAEWSAVEVTTAFYKRAVIAQQLVSWSVHLNVVELTSPWIRSTASPRYSLTGPWLELKN